MDAVKSFNQELSALYEVKPPISKAKMTALTRGAIKAIKFYKHVVQSVEKFILKCKPDYKVPGLYVIDSIVRQSRHQFGSDKDVFAPRFSKNIQQTFVNLFKCPPEDKSKIIRVLNLWQKNQVFPPEVIQPLFDFADPNNPIYKEIEASMQQQSTNGLNASSTSIIKGSPALQRTPTKGNQPGNESAHGSSSNLNLTDPNVIQQLQQLQRLISKNVENSVRSEQVHFDKKLLDFDYGDEEDEIHPSPRTQPNASDSILPVTSLLTNPEVLRQLQTLQQTMVSATQPEVDIDKMRKLQEMKQQEDEFDKHLAQTVPNLPFASECEFRGNNSQMMSGPGGITGGYFIEGMNPPAPQYQQQDYEPPPPPPQTIEKIPSQDNSGDVEVITVDHDDSRSPSPNDDRYRRRKRSRSRSRDRRGRDRENRKRSRSRSGSRRHRSRSRERADKNKKEKEKDKKEDKEKETEKDKERKKRGLPAIKKDHLSVCSTTLWVGHLSKLVHQDDLSNTFGEFGDVVSIDLIPPRGCAFIVMLRRQDAARCLGKLKGHVLHGKAITLAWAPGKGVKGKDLKDYWEGDLGVSYIPFVKIKEDIDIDMLEDGGMVDEDTMPDWMKQKIERMGKKNIPIDMQSYMIPDMPKPPNQIDTSQPPPMPGAGLLQPPPMLPLVSPFQFNSRLLGMNVPPSMMPNMANAPNIPFGVPPPNMTGHMMPNQLIGIGSPFQGPPGMMPPQLAPVDNKTANVSTEANLQSLSKSLMSITQSFGLVPQPPGPQEDTMDIEMEDAEKPSEKPSSFNEQTVGGAFNRSNRTDDRRDRRDDKDKRNRSRDRERERDRDRERGRDRPNSRERERDRKDRGDRDVSRGRDRDRRDDRRERNNRWGDRDRENRDRDRRDSREVDSKGDDRRDREKTLNDRLREMAGMSGFDEPNRDRNRDRSFRDRRSDSGSRFQPSNMRGNDRLDEDFSKGSQMRDQPRSDFSRSSLRPKFEEQSKSEQGSSDKNKDNKSPVNDPINKTETVSSDKTMDPSETVDKLPETVKIHNNTPVVSEGQFESTKDQSNEGPPAPLLDGPPQIMEGPPGMRMAEQTEMMDVPSDMMIMDESPEMRGSGTLHFEPPDMLNGPPPLLFDGPPNMMFNGPPNMMFNGPPNMIFDGPPNRMMNGPPDMMDVPPNMRMRGRGRGRRGLPNMRDGPPNMRDGPPNMRDGPPNMRDGPPNMIMDGPPEIPNDSPMMMDRPRSLLDDAPPHVMHFRDDREDRYMRGGRRDFAHRGMRGPPDADFFPRDDFSPRGFMRGGPRGHRGRGQFFGPRGRGRGQYREGPNFNPHFDGPPVDGPPFDGPPFDGPQFDGPPFDGPPFDGPPFDGPPFDGPPFDGPPFDGPPFDEPPFDRPPFHGPPFDGPFDGSRFDEPPYDRPPFDEPPFRGPGPRTRSPFDDNHSKRFRGSRFEERTWNRPDLDDMEGGPPPSNRLGRGERRSRWGEESHFQNEEYLGNDSVIEQDGDGYEERNTEVMADNREETADNREETADNREETFNNREETFNNQEEPDNNREETANNQEETCSYGNETANNGDETANNGDETANNQEEMSYNRDETSTPVADECPPPEEAADTNPISTEEADTPAVD